MTPSVHRLIEATSPFVLSRSGNTFVRWNWLTDAVDWQIDDILAEDLLATLDTIWSFSWSVYSTWPIVDPLTGHFWLNVESGGRTALVELDDMGSWTGRVGYLSFNQWPLVIDGAIVHHPTTGRRYLIGLGIAGTSYLFEDEGDWDAFKDSVPNETMCADGELVRVGFMSPRDVEAFINQLREVGLTYLDDGTARDLVVVDQLRGPAVPCEWIECGQVNLDRDPSLRVTACRLKGSAQSILVRPEEWTFAGSLSESFGFVPNAHVEKSLTFLRREKGLDVYRNELTGKEVYIGRTLRDESP